jgi:hypothetical protein
MVDPWLQQLRDWQAFYVLTGTAAATLTALMFVVVSLGAASGGSETATNAVRAFVTPTVVYFTTVLVLAALMIMPLLTPAWLSGLLALGGLGGLGYVGATGVHTQWRQNRLGREDWYGYIGLPVAAYGLLVVSAVELWMHAQLGLGAAAIADLLFIVVGIRNAWDLALWVAQQRRP